jgi:ABC-type antimicrobial peptide transport system, ATPase component
MNILRIEKLKKYYGTGENIIKALDDINLDIDKEEFVSIIGMSGSGKSTLLNMIGGLDSPTSGEVIVNGKKLGNMSDEDASCFRRQEIGFVFQNYNLIPILNVYENIVLPIELDGKKVEQEFLKEIAQTLEIENKMQAMPSQLSGGQQQRVAIARAIVSKPSIILADEPTGSLDSVSGKKVFELLKEVNKKFRQTVIMVTHNEEMAQQGDRIIIVKDGKIKL